MRGLSERQRPNEIGVLRASGSPFVFLLVTLAALCAFPAWAGKTGVMARSGTLRLEGLAAPSPQSVFSDGSIVDLWPVAQWVNTSVHDDSAIVIFEPESGAIFEASTDSTGIQIQSLDIGTAATLGELLDEPGAVIRFESNSPANADPFLAEQFEAVYPDARRSAYVAGPFRATEVPEPGLGLGLGIGLLSLAESGARRRGRC